MDAVELLRSDAPFIADTSAWWRVASLPSTTQARRVAEGLEWLDVVPAEEPPTLP